jgi:hypothetical protein
MGFERRSLHQFGTGLVVRRIAAGIVDGMIEVVGGLLGSYFGVMVAALLVAMQNEPPEELQRSMWSGMGFGFVFWALSISFLNRVLIQGLSRSSIGKKLFKLEVISTDSSLTWTTMMTRWVMSYGSLVIGGLGYTYMFFNREMRAFHDSITQTDVVPVYSGISMSVEYRESLPMQVPISLHGFSPLTILVQPNAERPTALIYPNNVIALPTRETKVAATVAAPETIAELIELHPKSDQEKKIA